MSYPSHIFSKLKRIFKFLFVLFIVALILLNALLVNIYSNILVNLRGEQHEQQSSLSSSVENIRLPSPLRGWPTSIPVGDGSGSSSSSSSVIADNFTFSPDDYSTLLNITNFRFLLAHVDKCNSNTNSSTTATPQPLLFMIIFVHSAPENFAKREAIRRTWANPANLIQGGHNEIRVVFLLGQSSNASQWALVKEEDRSHGDLVVGSFVDSYRNLTYKHIMGLKWVSYHCPTAQYVFKTDDDIFVDLRQLTFYLKGTFGGEPRRLMACYLNRRSWANRSYRNKWRVSYAEYPEKYYPRYCSGWGIIMSPDVVRQLYSISLSRPYFWIDDVFISGLLAADLGLQQVDLAERVTIDYEHVDRWLARSRLTLPPIFGFPDSATKQIYALWNKTTQYYAWQEQLSSTAITTTTTTTKTN